MEDNTVDNMLAEYIDLKIRYDKLTSFIQRVEDGSSPIHDDYPVGELYEQQKSMAAYLASLKGRLGYEGVEVE